MEHQLIHTSKSHSQIHHPTQTRKSTAQAAPPSSFAFEAAAKTHEEDDGKDPRRRERKTQIALRRFIRRLVVLFLFARACSSAGNEAVPAVSEAYIIDQSKHPRKICGNIFGVLIPIINQISLSIEQVIFRKPKCILRSLCFYRTHACE